MKFLDAHELNLFFVESGKVSKINTEDFTSYEPDVDLLEGIFIKRQERKKSMAPDHRKGADTEGQWRGMRYKMLKGIRRFHKSTEGKRQHRAMARFLVNKDFRPNLKTSSILSMQEKSHLVTDLDNYVLAITEFQKGYFHPIDDHFDLVAIKNILTDMCEALISCLISPHNISEEQAEFIDCLVEPGNIIEVLAESLGKTTSEVSVIWEKEKAELVTETTEMEIDFYSKLADRVRDSFGQ